MEFEPTKLLPQQKPYGSVERSADLKKLAFSRQASTKAQRYPTMHFDS
jgi:hypothetical protein